MSEDCIKCWSQVPRNHGDVFQQLEPTAGTPERFHVRWYEAASPLSENQKSRINQLAKLLLIIFLLIDLSSNWLQTYRLWRKQREWARFWKYPTDKQSFGLASKATWTESCWRTSPLPDVLFTRKKIPNVIGVNTNNEHGYGLSSVVACVRRVAGQVGR